MKITRRELESAAKAMYEHDWPKDKWERLGPGYHQDRYKAMLRTALAKLNIQVED